MKEVIKILVERDRISAKEAQEILDECRAEMDLAMQEGEFTLCEDIWMSYTGLEPDYMLEALL